MCFNFPYADLRGRIPPTAQAGGHPAATGKPYRVAFDLSLIAENPHVGIGSYSRGLLKTLPTLPEAEDWQFYALAAHDQDLGYFSLAAQIKVLRLPPARLNRGSALFSHQWALPKILQRQQIDLYHAPGLSLTPSMPAPPLWGLAGTACVVTIHDLNPLFVPEIWGQNFFALRKRLFYRFLLKRLAHSAFVITDSAHSARDIRSHMALSAERLDIIHLAVDEELLRQSDAPAAGVGIDQPFILHVGTGHKNKNVPALLKAFALLKDTLSTPLKLGLVGSYPDIQTDIAQICPGYAADIIQLGRVSTASLARLYRTALLLLFPSTYEGFGLPPLEAMTLGCPVVCSNAASLAEIVADGGVLCAPHDVRAMSAAMQRIMLEPAFAASLRQQGSLRAASFSWAVTARQTLAVYLKAGLAK